MARRLVGIMAKAPLAGYAKTRLIPVLGAAQAALLQQQMLLDTIELVATALCGDGSITLVCPTSADRVALERIVPDGVGVVAHGQIDLMSGLDYALRHHLAQGYEQVVLVDGDSPTLPAQYIQSGFDHLEEDAVVLGPTLDGGYYLIGACQPRSHLFDWEQLDSATVCQQTRARAEALGAIVHMLPAWYDVDTAEDLERLCAELQQYPSRAPRTSRFLAGDGRQ
jgi:rSAM/selenodomain-associated transferase 1